MDDWQALWDARQAALESVLGPMDDTVLHAGIPFELGMELGGRPDIVMFRNHVPGVAYVTAELIGDGRQIPNGSGEYELMVVLREEHPWAPNLISLLAHVTLQEKLEPGETMDIAPTVPDGSSIVALYFADAGRFEVLGRPAGILLGIGIVQEELDACLSGGHAEVLERLRGSGVLPYTDFYRRSVI